MAENSKIKRSYCGTDCQMIEVGKKTVARCFKCVHRDYDGQWLTDAEAIVRLQKRVDELGAKRAKVMPAGIARGK